MAKSLEKALEGYSVLTFCSSSCVMDTGLLRAQSTPGELENPSYKRDHREQSMSSDNEPGNKGLVSSPIMTSRKGAPQISMKKDSFSAKAMIRHLSLRLSGEQKEDEDQIPMSPLGKSRNGDNFREIQVDDRKNSQRGDDGKECEEEVSFVEMLREGRPDSCTTHYSSPSSPMFSRGMSGDTSESSKTSPRNLIWSLPYKFNPKARSPKDAHDGVLDLGISSRRLTKDMVVLLDLIMDSSVKNRLVLKLIPVNGDLSVKVRFVCAVEEILRSQTAESREQKSKNLRDLFLRKGSRFSLNIDERLRPHVDTHLAEILMHLKREFLHELVNFPLVSKFVAEEAAKEAPF